MRLTATVREVVEMTGLSRSTILQRTYAGEIPSILIGKRRLYLIKDLETWLEQHRDDGHTAVTDMGGLLTSP